MKAIVTTGATREPIDSVRFISNLSSGRTGATICEALAARGWQVTQLHGIGSALASAVARRVEYTDHASLDVVLRALLGDGDCDAVVHAAAVGDFSAAEPAPGGKLESGQELVLRLRPTAKIIDRIRGYAGRRPLTLVGFKLTHDPDAARQARAARELLARSGADYVVQNDVGTITDDAAHRFVIHRRDSADLQHCAGRQALAAALAALLESKDRGSDA
jgi:phosphopantothenoylcysteine decarboxylase/phosphopantothenate--cysteine ligase